MLSIGEAAAFLGVSKSSLRRWDKMDIFHAFRTPGGHRRYDLSDLELFYRKTQNKTNIFEKLKYILCYARVSGHKQKEKDDLNRQMQKLIIEAKIKGETHPITISDVGSGLNPHRTGLKKALKLIKSGQISNILVTYKDRLTRFGFPFIQNFCSLFGVHIIEIEQSSTKSAQQRLINDMMALIACFSGKLYGMRSAKSRKSLSQKKLMQKQITRIIDREINGTTNCLIRQILAE